MPGVDAALFRRLLEVREVLMYSFDFEVLDTPLEPEAYTKPAPWLPAFRVLGAEHSIIGRDATGGVYVMCEASSDTKPCTLHVDTRGHAVFLGGEFAEALGLVLELPYWRELLTQTPSSELVALASAAEALERELLADMPALEAARADMFDTLKLPRLRDPVQALLDWAIRPRPGIRVLSPHGWEYQALLPGSNSR